MGHRGFFERPGIGHEALGLDIRRRQKARLGSPFSSAIKLLFKPGRCTTYSRNDAVGPQSV